MGKLEVGIFVTLYLFEGVCFGFPYLYDVVYLYRVCVDMEVNVLR